MSEARRAVVAVGAALVVSATSLTLMACYGCPNCTYDECPGASTYMGASTDGGDASCPDDAGRALADAQVTLDAGRDGAVDAGVIADGGDYGDGGDVDAGDASVDGG